MITPLWHSLLSDLNLGLNMPLTVKPRSKGQGNSINFLHLYLSGQTFPAHSIFT